MEGVEGYHGCFKELKSRLVGVRPDTMITTDITTDITRPKQEG